MHPQFVIGESISVQTLASDVIYTGNIYYHDNGLLVLQDGDAWHILKTVGLKVTNGGSPRNNKQQRNPPHLPLLSFDQISQREKGILHFFTLI